MNLVFLHGRLTKDVEIRYSQSGNQTAIGNFSIAVRRDFTRDGQPDTDFFNCVAFGKTAENIEKYFKKGYGIIIKGRLQNDSYEKDDGTKVTYTKVIVEGFDFAEKTQAADNSQQASGQPAQTNSRPPQMAYDEDDDLPF